MIGELRDELAQAKADRDNHARWHEDSRTNARTSQVRLESEVKELTRQLADADLVIRRQAMTAAAQARGAVEETTIARGERDALLKESAENRNALSRVRLRLLAL